MASHSFKILMNIEKVLKESRKMMSNDPNRQVFSSIEEKLDNLRELMSSFIELQDILLEIDATSIDSTVDFINENNLISTKTLSNEVLQSINMSIRARPNNLLHYIGVLLKLKESIITQFRPIDLLITFKSHKNVLLALYDEGCIDIDSIKKFCYDEKEYFKFFFPEIKENDSQYFYERVYHFGIEQFFNKIDIDTFYKNRKRGHCEWDISELIRNDDLEAFQTRVSSTNLNLSTSIPPSLFESDEVINSPFLPLPTMMEYAAFFNSSNIFKFLWMSLQLNELPNELPKYAIAGGNYDIIHLCEGKLADIGQDQLSNQPAGQNIQGINDQNDQLDNAELKRLKQSKQQCLFNFDETSMSIAIEYHHMDIVDYLHDSIDIEFSVWLLQKSIKCFNLAAFFQILDFNHELATERDIYGMTALHFACENGHLAITKFLLSLQKTDLNAENWISIEF